MQRIIGYVRVSTTEQADKGVSIEAQSEKLRAYAKLFDLDLVDIVVDAGQSAKSLDRPGLQRVLASLKSKQADGILVVKLDRLTRSVGDLDALIQSYFSERAGKLLISVSDHIDTRSAAGRLVLNVLASVGQWERESCGERTRDALKHKKNQRQRVGAVPFGFALASDGKSLVEDASEQEALQIVRELRAQGLSLRKMVDELNNQGVPTAQGAKWHLATVQRALKAVA